MPHGKCAKQALWLCSLLCAGKPPRGDTERARAGNNGHQCGDGLRSKENMKCDRGLSLSAGRKLKFHLPQRFGDKMILIDNDSFIQHRISNVKLV
jgi:hypothetical protein